MHHQRIPVLQLVDGFATEEASGGAAQFGIQLARHLDPQRYASFVCGLWRYDTQSEQRWREQLHAEGIGTTILIEQRGSLPADMVRASAFLGHLLDRVRPSIINSHFERGDLLGLRSKVVHPSHPHIVRTMHADQQWQTRPWLGRLLNLAVFPWFFDAEVAISEATRQVMDARLGARLRQRRAVVLYNGVSSALIRRMEEARARTPRPEHLAEHRPPRLLIIGRLELQKGHAYLLRAVAELRRHNSDVELWVVGTGSLLDELQALVVELGIADVVRFLGQRNDIADLLLDVELLISSSIWEGFPTVVLEAMAAGVAVIATDVSGSRELVRNGETGVLVPMAQPQALATAIQHLLRNPDDARRMAANAQRQSQRYTLEHTADGYDQLYRKLVDAS